MTDYASQIDAALNLLGTTPDEIARSLENKGIRAPRIHEEADTTCALAVYLKELFPEAAQVSIYGVAMLGNDEGHWFASAPTTDAVRQFARRFDQGDFPYLVAS